MKTFSNCISIFIRCQPISKFPNLQISKLIWGCPCGPGYPFQVRSRASFAGFSTSIPHPADARVGGNPCGCPISLKNFCRDHGTALTLPQSKKLKFPGLIGISVGDKAVPLSLRKCVFDTKMPVSARPYSNLRLFLNKFSHRSYILLIF